MQKPELHIFEKKLMLIGILLFVCAWFFGTKAYLQPFTPILLKSIGSVLLLAFLQWLTVRAVLSFFRTRYPGYNKILQRILLSIPISGFAGMFIATFIYVVPSIISGERTYSFLLTLEYFGPMFFFSALVVGAHEVLYNFFELRRLDKEKEELKKANIQTQLDSLKTQVNPHFLFNSLNTLLALISTSPPKAEQFVLELSSVYRYLLQENEKGLASLRDELAFTHSYFHLLKTRYDAGIQLLEEVGEEYLDYVLPSLTLQLLLENAVKHNVIATTKPLTIVLRTERREGDDVYLVVQNNLQRKAQSVTSSKMGLTNIISKFKLLNREDVLITDKGNAFTVIIPLMKKQIA